MVTVNRWVHLFSPSRPFVPRPYGVSFKHNAKFSDQISSIFSSMVLFSLGSQPSIATEGGGPWFSEEVIPVPTPPFNRSRSLSGETSSLFFFRFFISFFFCPFRIVSRQLPAFRRPLVFFSPPPPSNVLHDELFSPVAYSCLGPVPDSHLLPMLSGVNGSPDSALEHCRRFSFPRHRRR